SFDGSPLSCWITMTNKKRRNKNRKQSTIEQVAQQETEPVQQLEATAETSENGHVEVQINDNDSTTNSDLEALKTSVEWIQAVGPEDTIAQKCLAAMEETADLIKNFEEASKIKVDSVLQEHDLTVEHIEEEQQQVHIETLRVDQVVEFAQSVLVSDPSNEVRSDPELVSTSAEPQKRPCKETDSKSNKVWRLTWPSSMKADKKQIDSDRMATSMTSDMKPKKKNSLLSRLTSSPSASESEVQELDQKSQASSKLHNPLARILPHKKHSIPASILEEAVQVQHALVVETPAPLPKQQPQFDSKTLKHVRRIALLAARTDSKIDGQDELEEISDSDDETMNQNLITIASDNSAYSREPNEVDSFVHKQETSASEHSPGCHISHKEDSARTNLSFLLPKEMSKKKCRKSKNKRLDICQKIDAKPDVLEDKVADVEPKSGKLPNKKKFQMRFRRDPSKQLKENTDNNDDDAKETEEVTEATRSIVDKQKNEGEKSASAFSRKLFKLRLSRQNKQSANEADKTSQDANKIGKENLSANVTSQEDNKQSPGRGAKSGGGLSIKLPSISWKHLHTKRDKPNADVEAVEKQIKLTSSTREEGADKAMEEESEKVVQEIPIDDATDKVDVVESIETNDEALTEINQQEEMKRVNGLAESISGEIRQPAELGVKLEVSAEKPQAIVLNKQERRKRKKKGKQEAIAGKREEETEAREVPQEVTEVAQQKTEPAMDTTQEEGPWGQTTSTNVSIDEDIHNEGKSKSQFNIKLPKLKSPGTKRAQENDKDKIVDVESNNADAKNRGQKKASKCPKAENLDDKTEDPKEVALIKDKPKQKHGFRLCFNRSKTLKTEPQEKDEKNKKSRLSITLPKVDLKKGHKDSSENKTEEAEGEKKKKTGLRLGFSSKNSGNAEREDKTKSDKSIESKKPKSDKEKAQLQTGVDLDESRPREGESKEKDEQEKIKETKEEEKVEATTDKSNKNKRNFKMSLNLPKFSSKEKAPDHSKSDLKVKDEHENDEAKKDKSDRKKQGLRMSLNLPKFNPKSGSKDEHSKDGDEDAAKEEKDETNKKKHGLRMSLNLPRLSPKRGSKEETAEPSELASKEKEEEVKEMKDEDRVETKKDKSDKKKHGLRMSLNLPKLSLKRGSKEETPARSKRDSKDKDEDLEKEDELKETKDEKEVETEKDESDKKKRGLRMSLNRPKLSPKRGSKEETPDHLRSGSKDAANEEKEETKKDESDKKKHGLRMSLNRPKFSRKRGSKEETSESSERASKEKEEEVKETKAEKEFETKKDESNKKKRDFRMSLNLPKLNLNRGSKGHTTDKPESSKSDLQEKVEELEVEEAETKTGVAANKKHGPRMSLNLPKFTSKKANKDSSKLKDEDLEKKEDESDKKKHSLRMSLNLPKFNPKRPSEEAKSISEEKVEDSKKEEEVKETKDGDQVDNETDKSEKKKRSLRMHLNLPKFSPKRGSKEETADHSKEKDEDSEKEEEVKDSKDGDQAENKKDKSKKKKRSLRMSLNVPKSKGSEEEATKTADHTKSDKVTEKEENDETKKGKSDKKKNAIRMGLNLPKFSMKRRSKEETTDAPDSSKSSAKDQSEDLVKKDRSDKKKPGLRMSVNLPKFNLKRGSKEKPSEKADEAKEEDKDAEKEEDDKSDKKKSGLRMHLNLPKFSLKGDSEEGTTETTESSKRVSEEKDEGLEKEEVVKETKNEKQIETEKCKSNKKKRNKQKRLNPPELSLNIGSKEETTETPEPSKSDSKEEDKKSENEENDETKMEKSENGVHMSINLPKFSSEDKSTDSSKEKSEELDKEKDETKKDKKKRGLRMSLNLPKFSPKKGSKEETPDHSRGDSKEGEEEAAKDETKKDKSDKKKHGLRMSLNLPKFSPKRESKEETSKPSERASEQKEEEMKEMNNEEGVETKKDQSEKKNRSLRMSLNLPKFNLKRGSKDEHSKSGSKDENKDENDGTQKDKSGEKGDEDLEKVDKSDKKKHGLRMSLNLPKFTPKRGTKDEHSKSGSKDGDEEAAKEEKDETNKKKRSLRMSLNLPKFSPKIGSKEETADSSKEKEEKKETSKKKSDKKKGDLSKSSPKKEIAESVSRDEDKDSEMDKNVEVKNEEKISKPKKKRGLDLSLNLPKIGVKKGNNDSEKAVKESKEKSSGEIEPTGSNKVEVKCSPEKSRSKLNIKLPRLSLRKSDDQVSADVASSEDKVKPKETKKSKSVNQDEGAGEESEKPADKAIQMAGEDEPIQSKSEITNETFTSAQQCADSEQDKEALNTLDSEQVAATNVETTVKPQAPGNRKKRRRNKQQQGKPKLDVAAPLPDEQESQEVIKVDNPIELEIKVNDVTTIESAVGLSHEPKLETEHATDEPKANPLINETSILNFKLPKLPKKKVEQANKSDVISENKEKKSEPELEKSKLRLSFKFPKFHSKKSAKAESLETIDSPRKEDAEAANTEEQKGRKGKKKQNRKPVKTEKSKLVEEEEKVKDEAIKEDKKVPKFRFKFGQNKSPEEKQEQGKSTGEAVKQGPRKDQEIDKKAEAKKLGAIRMKWPKRKQNTTAHENVKEAAQVEDVEELIEERVV
ncbi:hypothetical protein Ciccas_009666, partial [Cichlidogyrus casuarinus]